jgi:hypothetical protein
VDSDHAAMMEDSSVLVIVPNLSSHRDGIRG